ncbi:SAM-dependent methyltransferase [Anaerobacillus alkalilacustris]|uniref:SAM-dependent methyltransferase n=1 Tax=Anaerobacillus alkalilacustris TaxID=393763 RepID=A0A1S2LJ33_9BACI|nr:class I SAM-dependent methyltransferase [Anaerobacillus alkalilacustris]OIJ12421.1 SAM-dependent methyltransferase [Anaerobacillus alkalilacustris]
MSQISFETFFNSIDESVEVIQNDHKLTYLEALIITGEFLFQGETEQPLSELAHKKVKTTLANVKIEQFSNEQIRKTFQLAILKGMKEGTQPQHIMTPDAVSMFVSFLVNKLTEKKECVRILDPTVGSGNLLTAILNNSNIKMDSFGIEPDETLLQLAYVSANLQQHNVEFFHQDSLTEIFIDPVDVVVADLPVGYYPNEEVAKRYNLKAEKGMSYTHHLIIEQMLNYTKQGGFLLFLIPNTMFETEQAKQLHSFIKEHAHIYSLLQLPKSMFKHASHGKSIFIIRKKGEGIKAPNQALLAELPSFSNKEALTEMINSINNWLEAYLN